MTDITKRIQALVFRGIKKHQYTKFFFCRLDDKGPSTVALRSFIEAELAEHSTITSAASVKVDPPPDLTVAVGFTYPALETLLQEMGAHYEPLVVKDNNNRLDRADPDARRRRGQVKTDSFKQGMAARRAELGDPDTDWAGRGSILFWASASSSQAIEPFERRVWAKLGEPFVEQGAWGGTEPGEQVVLGYLDGQSQPYVDELAGIDNQKTDQGRHTRLAGGGTITAAGWKPVPVGEFVLGHTDAGGAREAPHPHWLTVDGTFLVYRKYEINQTALDQLLDEHAANGSSRKRGRPNTTLSTDSLAAKLMGRYQAGSKPDKNGDDTLATGNGNDFRYADDTAGYQCPLGAHVRRSNPRDALGFDGDLVARHRIIRRGIPDRDWSQDSLGPERGLHFIAVNSRLQDQFEFIQTQWLNTGASFRVGTDPDIFVGSREPREAIRFIVQGDEPVVITSKQPISTMHGGDYFLMPGLNGLRLLAQWKPDGTQR